MFVAFVAGVRGAKGQHSAPRGGPPRSWTNDDLTKALENVWNKRMTTSQASRIFGIPYNSLLMYVRGKYGKSLKLDQLKLRTPAAHDSLNTIGNSRSTPKEKLKNKQQQQQQQQHQQQQVKHHQAAAVAAAAAARFNQERQQQHQRLRAAAAAAAATFGPAALFHAGLPPALLQEHMVAAAAAAAAASNNTNGNVQQLPHPPHPDGSRMRDLMNNLHREQQSGDDSGSEAAAATVAAMAAAKSGIMSSPPSLSRSSPMASSVGSLDDITRHEHHPEVVPTRMDKEDGELELDQEMRVQALLLQATQNRMRQLSRPDDEDHADHDKDGEEAAATAMDEDQNNNPDQIHEALRKDPHGRDGDDGDEHQEEEIVVEADEDEDDDMSGGRRELDVLSMAPGGEISAL